jgi:hypothetical protein
VTSLMIQMVLSNAEVAFSERPVNSAQKVLPSARAMVNVFLVVDFAVQFFTGCLEVIFVRIEDSGAETEHAPRRIAEDLLEAVVATDDPAIAGQYDAYQGVVEDGLFLRQQLGKRLLVALAFGDVAPNQYAVTTFVDGCQLIRQFEPDFPVSRGTEGGNQRVRRRIAPRIGPVRHLAQQVGKHAVGAVNAKVDEWCAEQRIGCSLQKVSQRHIGVGDRAFGQGDQDDEIGRVVEQRAKALQPLEILTQLGVVAFSKRATTEANDAVSEPALFLA